MQKKWKIECEINLTYRPTNAGTLVWMMSVETAANIQPTNSEPTASGVDVWRYDVKALRNVLTIIFN